jgi:hypothetical protein
MKMNAPQRWLLVLVLALVATPAFGQGGGVTSTITGVVLDSDGGAIPGATVTVRDIATGVIFNTMTTAAGTFNLPSMNPGTYSVTVALRGFKTVILNGVVLNAGVPTTVRATLTVGGLAETLVVQRASEMVQTQSSAVSTTLNIRQIDGLPLVTRNTLDFVTLLPGVQTPADNRDSQVNGLPQSTINIAVDGFSVQDNYLKTSDGFFARVSPRLDAIEEVTVTTAAQSAENSGQGASQIRFITRSGSNQFTGSVYEYFQDDKFNTNTYFNKRDNLPKAEERLNQYGTRVGGPIVSGRAFFFMNYEESRAPNTSTLNRTILTPAAQNGLFRYNTSGGVREVNLFTLPGLTTTADPTIRQLLADIRSSTTNGGTVTDLANPNQQRYSFQVPTSSHNRYPTARVDYQVSRQHRLSGSWNFNDIVSRPDVTNSRQVAFPGFPVSGDQVSDRYTVGGWLRSAVRTNVVNELRVGATGGASLFSPGLVPGLWSNSSVANQGGFQINLSSAGLSNASTTPTPTSREASTKLIEETLTLLQGPHVFTLGGSMTQVDIWLKQQSVVPTLGFDVVTGDPALTAFTGTGNFTGAANADVTAARQLYALLTGRVSQIGGNARLNGDTGQYEYLGLGHQRGRMRDLGFFAQDSWRMTTTLTLNLGLRYELQTPFFPLNNSYATATLDDAWGVSGNQAGCDPSAPTRETCNLFRPGTLTGRRPQFVQFGEGAHAFKTDFNNLAPSIGVNWSPVVERGAMRRILGEPGGFVVRGGFTRTYSRHGMTDFTDVFGANPGITLTADRNLARGNLVGGVYGTQLPVLLRDRTRLGAPTDIPGSPTYPIIEDGTGDVNIFDPNLQVPYADTWSAGVQRAIGKDTAFEIRYIGTRHRDGWTEYNYNEVNILDNGFLDEFKLAQANLQSHIAAGCGGTGVACSFAYRGPGTGTSPLPIYLAYFSGVPRAQASDVARYTSTLFTNSNFINPLQRRNPNPFTPAGVNQNTGLGGTPERRTNAAAAGLPVNFFIANPDALGGANVTGNGAFTKYSGLQVEMRRRLSQSLQFGTSYVYGKAFLSSRYSFRVPRLLTRDVGAIGDITHAFKANWIYELPFGVGHRFGGNAGPVLDRLIGGWQVSGTARVQSGRLLDFGNVRMVGFNADALRAMYKLRTDGNRQSWMLPEDVITETIKAFSLSATSASGYGPLGAPSGRYFAPANGPDCIETISNGYGDCGERSLVVTGPTMRFLDLALAKKVRLAGRTSADIRFDLLNAFDFVNFNPVTGVGAVQRDGFEVLTAESGRTIQLVMRFNW